MATLRLQRFHHREPGRERAGHPGSAREHPWLRGLSGIFWSLAGGLVLLFVFFAAMGAFDPVEAAGVTIAFAALGVLWFVHAWPRLRGTGGGEKRARERRGY